MSAVSFHVVPVFSALSQLAFQLRREVFVCEQGVPEAEEFDADDLTATHVVALFEGEVIGTLRLIWMPEHAKIGRVALRKSLRGRGIAQNLLQFAMNHARGRGEEKFYLAAQCDKLGFYEKFGFSAYGEIFSDGGIAHQAMKTY